ncbi:MAG: DNA topoisomerase family protein, partial [Ktedonobacteraceae bacterium]
RTLVIRTGRFWRFISCSGFPECSYRRSVVNKTGALCPACGGDLVERKTRQKKRIFYGCNNYPTCNFAMWEKPIPDVCPNCHGLMAVVRPGQDPVCYQEVIVPQRSKEEKPHQDGTSKRRGFTRAKKADSADELNGAKEIKKRSATRRATATKKTATTRARASTTTSAKKPATKKAAAVKKPATVAKKTTATRKTTATVRKSAGATARKTTARSQASET